MNAVKLVMLYGSSSMRATLAHDVRHGSLLGVWGADDPVSPVDFVRQGEFIRLAGAKRFASGLGLVDQAIVLAPGPIGKPQMLLVPVGDLERADASGWKMAGMRATRSGRYDLDGTVIGSDQSLGSEGDYLREPHFEGGIWRYCATHLGGAEALYQHLMQMLVDSKRADDSNQRRRVVICATALETARLWLTRCALEIESAEAGAGKASLALLAREVTENTCRTVIEQVEQGLGMVAHELGSPVERIKRDLSLFLCQAGPDAKRERAGHALVSSLQLAEML